MYKWWGRALRFQRRPPKLWRRIAHPGHARHLAMTNACALEADVSVFPVRVGSTIILAAKSRRYAEVPSCGIHGFRGNAIRDTHARTSF